MKYLYVEGHLNGDYFVKNDGTEEQIMQIEEICPQCGEHDMVVDVFSTFEDVKNIINCQNYNTEYTEELLKEAKVLFEKSE